MIESEKVTETFMSLLFADEEITDNKTPKNTVVVEGLTGSFGLHAGRLQENKKAIVEWIAQLPSKIDEGCSFLELCNDNQGNQWTSFQRTVEQLMVMGLAVGCVKCCTPRELWSILPGCVPYYQRVEVSA